MKDYGLHFEGAMIYWIAGLIITALCWWGTLKWGSIRGRRAARALVLAAGLGVAVVPTGTGLAITPSTQVLIHGLILPVQAASHLAWGSCYFLLNLICAYFALSLWRADVQRSGRLITRL